MNARLYDFNFYRNRRQVDSVLSNFRAAIKELSWALQRVNGETLQISKEVSAFIRELKIIDVKCRTSLLFQHLCMAVVELGDANKIEELRDRLIEIQRLKRQLLVESTETPRERTI